ncbi:hypothetical protein [Chitinophaga rhizophila]|uniref:DUF4199 domain-containing protein n=1 Tax=Chitinophaga rhizophila TaxID=2866212 RepID=A0ABS7GDU8_9BACT|nr:hypothetical protein [Chitinophaga rhizophila]MBW8685596.1 hypothetical protein [Chitinophaga rhizophila]
MGFDIKLFRLLNGIGIFITGAMLLFSLLGMLQSGDLLIFMPLLFLGGTFYHGILAGSLRKSLQYPEVPLKDSTLVRLQALSFFPIMIGLVVISSVTKLNDPEIRDMLVSGLEKQAAEQKQTLPDGYLYSVLNFGQIMMTTYGVILIGNAVLAMFYMKQWKDRQEEKDHKDQQEGQDDIGI